MAKGRFTSLEFEGEEGRGSRSRAEAGHFVAEVVDAQSYLRQAEAQELAGDHEAALQSYSAALGENYLLLDAWTGQVRMLLELGEYPETRLWADKALEKFPDNPQLLAAKSLALFRMGHEHDARGLNDVALQGKGEWPMVWLCRGELMLEESQAASVECFNRAVRCAESKGLALMQAGAAMLRHKLYSLALSTLQDAAAQLPRAARVWHLLGCAQEALGLVAQARVSYEQAHQLAPRLKLYHEAALRKGGGIGAFLKGTLRRLFGR